VRLGESSRSRAAAGVEAALRSRRSVQALQRAQRIAAAEPPGTSRAAEQSVQEGNVRGPSVAARLAGVEAALRSRRSVQALPRAQRIGMVVLFAQCCRTASY
jgi:hypothetical protein